MEKSKVTKYCFIAKETSLYYQEKPITALLLGFATWGLYSYWWHYKNWCLVNKNTGNNLYPVLRAYFFPIYAYSLFDLVADTADELSVRSGFFLRIFGLMNVVSAVFWFVPGNNFLPILGIFSFFLIPVISIWFVQLKVKKINLALGNISKSQFGVEGILAVTLIAIQVFLVLYLV